jgi:hypothetical protein
MEAREIVEQYLADIREAKTHTAKHLVTANFLRDVFDVQICELIPGIEKELGSKMLGIKGRADQIFGDVVLEFKVDLEKELDDAIASL